MNPRILLLPSLILVFQSCTKSDAYSQYSGYYPDLMETKIVREAPFTGPVRASIQETQMELVGPVLFVLDPGEGVHAYRAFNQSKYLFLIAPGCSYMTPTSTGIVVDRTIDLVEFGQLSTQTVAYRGSKLNVLEELRPPDGKEIPPIFQRNNRLKNTEIIRWQN